MDEMLETAAEAARSAGDMIIKAARRLSDVGYASKGRNDFVSETDTQAEQEIIRILRQTRGTVKQKVTPKGHKIREVDQGLTWGEQREIQTSRRRAD